jgi:hypothetical protein
VWGAAKKRGNGEKGEENDLIFSPTSHTGKKELTTVLAWSIIP